LTATGIAVNAVSAGQVNIPVTVRDSTGATITTDPLMLNANGHTQFALVTDKYPMTRPPASVWQADDPHTYIHHSIDVKPVKPRARGSSSR